MTEECKVIANIVRELSTGPKRQTLLYLSDVLKGANTKKIRDYHHNSSPYYAKLQSWHITDIQRLLQKMVLENYLQEEMIFCKDIPQAYLRLGTRVAQLMNGAEKVDFVVKIIENKTKQSEPVACVVPAAAGSAAGSSTSALILDNKTKELLGELRDKCQNDLLGVCQKLAVDRGVTIFSIMNLQAIKEMAQKMPVCEEQMLSIPHVTKANFDKYGRELLEVTEKYAAEKVCK